MDFNVDHTLNCEGLSCPMPILKLAKELKSIESGQILELLGTDPGSKSDIPKWCDKTGNNLVDSTEDDGIYKFYIRKK